MSDVWGCFWVLFTYLFIYFSYAVYTLKFKKSWCEDNRVTKNITLILIAFGTTESLLPVVYFHLTVTISSLKYINEQRESKYCEDKCLCDGENF
jgi:hypothetical protein